MEEMGEEALLIEVRRLFASEGDDVILGIGDDAAVVDAPAATKLAWTTDMLVEGVHFQTGWQSAEELGRKSLMVNLSDLAAMASQPLYALVSLAIEARMEAEYVLDLCRGIKSGCDEYGLRVIGGDTTASGSGLIINISAAGSVSGDAMARSGAAPGEAIVVTGALGGAAAGMRLLAAGTGDAYPGLLRAFRSPEPRLAAAMAARDAGATSMTDISDGLATDLRHICAASGVGATIDIASLPHPPELDAACREHGWDREALALGGGEDYELLATFPAESVDGALKAIEQRGDVRAAVIGQITADAGAISVIAPDGHESALKTRGFEHFRHD